MSDLSKMGDRVVREINNSKDPPKNETSSGGGKEISSGKERPSSGKDNDGEELGKTMNKPPAPNYKK